MLRAGAGLPEIGQVPRHRRLASTAIYAKTDISALRALAHPWPGGGIARHTFLAEAGDTTVRSGERI